MLLLSEVAAHVLPDDSPIVKLLYDCWLSGQYWFGSFTTAGLRGESDIALAVRGCPKGKFFHLLGRLLMELEHPVDLVDLDGQHAFARYLEEEGELLQVG
jgi:predicted nucleotidyltransferase